MLAIALLIFGFISLGRIGLGFIPNIEFPITAVIVPYPGADPIAVEEQVTSVMEPSLRTISGVNNVYATSAENVALFVMEFKWGTDLKEVSDEIRTLLDIISLSLPSEAGKPIIYKLDPNQIPLASYSITGKDDLLVGNYLDTVLKPALESLEEVAGVMVAGAKIHEVQVSYYPEKLQEYNISPQTLSQLIHYQNIQVPSGRVFDEDKIYNLRTGSTFSSLDDLQGLVVGQAKTQTVSPFLGIPIPKLIKLGEVADVKEVYRSSGQYTTINGSPAIVVSIFKSADANTVRTSREVRKKIEELSLGDIEIEKLFDQSDYIEDALRALALNGLFGAILAVAVLYFFLRNWRTTIVTAIAIPFSVIVTFTIMYATGVNINLISLGGLALGLGMLVDNSIVVLENIYRKRQEGASQIEAAVEGTSEVGMAITASTLTTLVVFLPVVFMSTLAGHIFRELALTVSFSLASSLIVALTIVPLLASRIIVLDEKDFHENKDITKGFTGFQYRYGKRLEKVLEEPAKWLWITAGALILSLLLIPFMNFEMLPEENINQVSVSLELPPGTPADKTIEVIKEIEPEITKIDHVEKVYTRAGKSTELSIDSIASGAKDNRANMLVLLENPRDVFAKQVDVNKVADQIRAVIDDATKKYPELESKVSVDSLLAQAGLETSVTVKVKGSKDEEVESVAKEIMQELKNWPEFASVSWSYSEQEPLLNLDIDTAKVLMGGQISGQLAMSVRQAIVGENAGRISLGGSRVPIVIKAHDQSVKTLSDLEDLYFPGSISLGEGPSLGLRLGNVVSVEKTTAPLFLQKEGGERVIEVTGIPATDLSGKANKKIRHYLKDLELPQGVSAEVGGLEKIRASAYRDLFYAALLALSLVYMVMASQFEALRLPLIIMVTMPLALIGALVFIFLYSQTLSIPALIGMIILAGIVVNNGIVLVDYINQLRKSGLELREAVLKGSKDRLRAILMTALTTILGLLPMALSLGSSTNIQVPMAVSVMGGLITATFLTLFIIPCIYIQIGKVEDRKNERQSLHNTNSTESIN